MTRGGQRILLLSTIINLSQAQPFLALNRRYIPMMGTHNTT